MVEGDTELLIFVFPPSKSWDYRGALLYPIYTGDTTRDLHMVE